MIFILNPTFIIDTDKDPWRTEGLRIGLWGGSGCGKSNTAALLAEQFLSQGGTLVVFEPRAEYHTLKEKFDVIVCGGPYGKDLDFVPSSPATYAKAVVEQGVSIIFYTSDVEDEAKLIEFTARFLHYLLKYNEVAKRPIMLITEETEEYAPISTKGRESPPWVFSRMIRQFKTAARDARKLNIVTVNLSPRPQEINFTIRQLCNLTFFGKFSPQDASYVDRECLKHYKQSLYRGKDLLTLNTGQFAVIISGKAIPLQTITEPRQTKHGAETPKLEYVAPRTEKTEKAVTDLSKTIKKALEKEKAKEDKIQQFQRKAKYLADQLQEKQEEVDRLRSALEVAGVIKIEAPEPQVIETIKDPEALQHIRELARELWLETEKIISPQTPKPSIEKTWEVWAPKIPSRCAKKVFRFLLDNVGAKFSKSEIAVKTGYSSRSGTFSSALSFLKRQNLVKYDGRFLWCE